MSLGTAQLLDTRALTKPLRCRNEWNFQFWGYVGLLSQFMHTHMKGVSRRSLYFLLTQWVAGRAFVTLKAVPDQHGYEAWRRLCAQCEPTTSIRSAGMLKALISPDFKNGLLESWESSWLHWEAEAFRYKREGGKQLPMETRVSV
eukprot:2950300-Amphidinium_carterae.1